jgi:uncharacterized protein (DUF427 family)
MALTYGSGPFGPQAAGRFNFDAPRRGVLYLEDSPRRVRGFLGGEPVVDSRRVKLLHESRHLPVWYFPQEDLRMDRLRPTEHSTHCPWKGDASYWSVVHGDRLLENAVWSYPEPLAGAEALAGLMAFRFAALDRWLEEEEAVIGHPRDPYHRIDVRQTSRHVRVSLNGEVVAETRRAKVLFEAGLPPRWYIPLEDVRQAVLVESDKGTVCAYKGHASYWSARVGDALEEDVLWAYREPLHDARPVEGHVAFFNEHVDIELDGEPQERPRTQWSRR